MIDNTTLIAEARRLTKSKLVDISRTDTALDRLADALEKADSNLTEALAEVKRLVNVPAAVGRGDPVSQDEARAEELADFIATERDKYPRRADDMDSEELAQKVIEWLASRKPEAAPSDTTRYEPCVVDADGECTRWSHDHDAASQPVQVEVTAAVECNNARFDLLRELAAAQAVIAEVRANVPADLMGRDVHLEYIAHTLAQSPTDALQARDRQVAAKALTDVRDELRRWAETNRPYTNMAQIAGVREASNIVGRRAAAIVSEPSTPEQEGKR